MDEGPNGAPMCPEHPVELVAGTCTRCGRFCCATCLQNGPLCRSCSRLSDRLATERKLTLMVRGLALGEGLRVALIVGWALVTRGVLGSDEQAWVYLGTALTALPFVGLALALWIAGRPWLTWLALSLDLLVFGTMAFRVSSQPLLAAALLALPVGMGLRVFRIQRLSRQLKLEPSPRAAS